jgi:hypothetical protein
MNFKNISALKSLFTKKSGFLQQKLPESHIRQAQKEAEKLSVIHSV